MVTTQAQQNPNVRLIESRTKTRKVALTLHDETKQTGCALAHTPHTCNPALLFNARPNVVHLLSTSRWIPLRTQLSVLTGGVAVDTPMCVWWPSLHSRVCASEECTCTTQVPALVGRFL